MAGCLRFLLQMVLRVDEYDISRDTHVFFMDFFLFVIHRSSCSGSRAKFCFKR